MVSVSVGEQRIPALARLVTLATLKADVNMFRFNVFVKDIHGALEVALNALPATIHFGHSGPNHVVRSLVELTH